MEQNKQFCKNCEHFVRYYLRYGTRFKESDNGFCAEKRPNGRACERKAESQTCDKFMPAQDKAEETEKNIKYCLTSIRRQLEYIASVIENEK